MPVSCTELRAHLSADALSAIVQRPVLPRHTFSSDISARVTSHWRSAPGPDQIESEAFVFEEVRTGDVGVHANVIKFPVGTVDLPLVGQPEASYCNIVDNIII